MDLFITDILNFEKIAGEITLPEDPNVWPQEILQELYKKVDYLSDFSLKVVMDKVDAERGYGFGHVLVGSKTGLPDTAKPDAQAAAGVQEIKIPIVIRDKKLQPFDICVTKGGKLLPLTEVRVRQALFRPQAFDVAHKTPGDDGMISQLYPPHRNLNRMGGVGYEMGKTSSAEDLLEQILKESEVKEALTPEDVARRVWKSKATPEAMARFKKKMVGFAARGQHAAASKTGPASAAASKRVGEAQSAVDQIKKRMRGEAAPNFGNSGRAGSSAGSSAGASSGSNYREEYTRQAEEAAKARGWKKTPDGRWEAPGTNGTHRAGSSAGSSAGRSSSGSAGSSAGSSSGSSSGPRPGSSSGPRPNPGPTPGANPGPRPSPGASAGSSASGSSAGPNHRSSHQDSSWADAEARRQGWRREADGSYSGRARNPSPGASPGASSRGSSGASPGASAGQKSSGPKPGSTNNPHPPGSAKWHWHESRHHAAEGNADEQAHHVREYARKVGQEHDQAVADARKKWEQAKQERDRKYNNYAAGGGGGGYSAPKNKTHETIFDSDKPEHRKAFGRAAAGAVGLGIAGGAAYGIHRALRDDDKGHKKAASVKEASGELVQEWLKKGLKTSKDPAQLRRAQGLLTRKGSRMLEAGNQKGLSWNKAGIFAGDKANALEGAGKTIIASILPTIQQDHHYSFLGELTPEVQQAFLKNAHASKSSLELLLNHEPSGHRKTASALAYTIRPSVISIMPHEDGYEIKTASHLAWAPISEIVDRGQLVDRFGVKVALAADQGGVTVSDQDVGQAAQLPGSASGSTPETISEHGMYKVHDLTGKEIVGFAWPNLIDVDGTSVPLVLFTNGSVATVQGEVVGEKVGEGAEMAEGRPEGHGFFYCGDKATVPLTVHGSFAQDGREVMVAENLTGEMVQVSIQPMIQEIVSQDGVLLIPEEFKFFPLGEAGEVALASTVPEWGQKMASINLGRMVALRATGDEFSIEGLPVEKLASDQTHWLSYGDALFLLSGLGVDLGTATQKLAQAYTFSAPVAVPVTREIQLLSERREEALKVAQANMDGFGFKPVLLVKEAAVIPDPVAVDSVLSIGFLNPENITSFLHSLPKLEEAQSKMCELLLATRLGLKDVPTPALEKSIKSLEQVIEGLKVLAFQETP